MRKLAFLLTLSTALLILSVCLYPDKERSENSMPPEADIQNVQSAVENFQKNEDGILPIKTSSDNVEYLEYQIDFTRISPQYLSDIPTTAYENGGNFQYVIIDAEENPTVKLDRKS